MPVKHRASKARRRITAEAVARFREVGPDALGPHYVADDALAVALGVPVLCALSADDMRDIRAGLEGATCR